LILGGAIGFIIFKKLSSANYEIYVEQAKAKAKAIEHEAEIVLQNAKISAKEAELEAKRRYEEEALRVKLEFEGKIANLEKKEDSLSRRVKEELDSIERQKREAEKNSEAAAKKIADAEGLKKEYSKKVEEIKSALSTVSGLTENEAKELLLKQVERDSRADIAHVVRKYETEAKEEAKKKANYILAQATTRFAGEFAAERLINVINLPDDDLKGRIIGKEDITLLKCTSSYPAPLEEANLVTIPDMAKRFGVKVGLSDHTLGITAPIVAVSLGAKVVEKHFIVDRRIGGADASFSLEPQEFGAMVKAIRETESALGCVNYELSPKIKSSREFSRSLFVVEDIAEGEELNAQNIRSIRPAFGLHPRYYDEVLGKKATKSIKRGTPLEFGMFK